VGGVAALRDYLPTGGWAQILKKLLGCHTRKEQSKIDLPRSNLRGIKNSEYRIQESGEGGLDAGFWLLDS
jgi:hypothetical protein